jgi:hypothetical protein
MSLWLCLALSCCGQLHALTLFLPTWPPPSLTDDTFAFWRGLKDAGLLDEVIQEFQQELEETMKGLQQRVQDPPLQLRGEGT